MGSGTGCVFELNDNGLWQCGQCGWIFPRRTDKPPTRDCVDVVYSDPKDTLADLRDLAAKAPESVIRSGIETLAIAAQEDPTILAQAAHWLIAGKRWAVAGWPVRSLAAAEACHVICKACPSNEYNKQTDSCRVCGCKVKASWLPLKSKPRMATEDCPKGHWPKT